MPDADHVPVVVTLRGVTYPTPSVTRIADITVDATTVYTPLGNIDRHRARWFLGGAAEFSRSCPWWAVTFAVVLIPCTGFLSLLMLLIKEPDTWASELRVTDGQVTYATTVYTRSREEFQTISDTVAWMQRAQAPVRRPVPRALPPAGRPVTGAS